MKDHIVLRMNEIAEHIITTKETIRATAKHMHVAKSTVHKDIMRLEKANKMIYEKVYEVILENKADRHMRGGIATKNKYRMVQ